MSKNVIILGINDGHDAGAALIKDGKVLAAIQEERLRNIKNYSGTPTLAIKKVFEIARINPSDLRAIAIVSLNRTYAPMKEMPLKLRLFEKISPFVHSHAFSNFYVKVMHKFRPMEELKKVFLGLGIEGKEVMFIEHHTAHAAHANYQRPDSKDALILTLDGAGDGLCATVNIGRKNEIQRIASSTYYDSPGNSFYSEITGYLGMKRWEHEYKIMGMAPYGRAEYCIKEMEKIIRINPKRPLEFQNTIGACNTQVQKKLRKMLAGQRFDNICAAAQLHFEGLVTRWVKNAVKETGLHEIACSGGSFLNVKANKLIREMDEIEKAFFVPAGDDGGTPIGAALEAYYRFCERDGVKAERQELKDLYYGNEYSNEEIEQTLKEKGWIDKAKYIDEIDAEIGKLISKGRVIGRFNGRDEWGPRALGNRSIVADPRDLRVIRKINIAIKMRDFWMPFAPAILEERIEDYLIDARPARYMIEAFDTPEKATEIIAGLHPWDRTARPQTLNEWNPGFKRIVEEFQDLTGTGGVLNTSFNLHGWPIVGSPEIALQTFENSGLDGLALGNYLILR